MLKVKIYRRGCRTPQVHEVSDNLLVLEEHLKERNLYKVIVELKKEDSRLSE